jgi:hypothetical protein
MWEQYYLGRTIHQPFRVLPCGVAVELVHDLDEVRFMVCLPSRMCFEAYSSRVFAREWTSASLKPATTFEVRRYKNFVSSAFPDAKLDAIAA